MRVAKRLKGSSELSLYSLQVSKVCISSDGVVDTAAVLLDMMEEMSKQEAKFSRLPPYCLCS